MPEAAWSNDEARLSCPFYIIQLLLKWNTWDTPGVTKKQRTASKYVNV